MPAKQILFDANARHKALRGVRQLAQAVKATYGPAGRNVAIDRRHRPPILTKDGVSVAAEIELPDPFENLALQLVKQAAAATSREAGDGTTTAIVLAEAIFQHGLRHVTAGCDPIPLKRGIEKAVTAAVAVLALIARPLLHRADFQHIATVSANGDPVLGDLIATALDRVGRDGAVTIEAGRGMSSVLDVVDGMQFDRGYVSSYFATSAATLEARLEDAYVLVLEQQLSHLHHLLPLLQAVVVAGRPLLIIAPDVVGEALSTLLANLRRRTLLVCAVMAPGYGEQRREQLADVAILCGCQPVTTETGARLEDLTLADLGQARHVTVGAETTLIREGAGAGEAVRSRARDLHRQIDAAAAGTDLAHLRLRLARLVGGVAVLRIGAATELEQHETMTRAEDALQATRAAALEGVVAGGGVALLRCRAAIAELDLCAAEAIGASIVSQALSAPLRVLCANAGLEPGPIVHQVAKATGGHGFNVATGRFEDLFAAGIIDPAKVTRVALQNAASIASLLLTTAGLLAEIPADGPVASR